jgi:hypothetical protein
LDLELKMQEVAETLQTVPEAVSSDLKILEGEINELKQKAQDIES